MTLQGPNDFTGSKWLCRVLMSCSLRPREQVETLSSRLSRSLRPREQVETLSSRLSRSLRPRERAFGDFFQKSILGTFSKSPFWGLFPKVH